MVITFLKTKDDPLYNFHYGIVEFTTDEPCYHEIITMQREKFLKLEIPNNRVEQCLVKAYEVKFTSKYMYIPMKYIMRIRKGISTQQYLKERD